jgi:hypothetical protein
MLLCSNKLLLLLLADMVQIFLFRPGKSSQPARGASVTRCKIGQDFIQLLVLGDCVPSRFGGIRISHDGGPQGLLFRSRVPLDFEHEGFEQPRAISRLAASLGDHREECSMPVVIFD